MKNLKVILSLLFMGGSGLLAIDHPPVYAESKIVAIVNNEIITQKDLNDFVNFTRMQYSKDYRGAELDKKMEELKPQLLNRLIEDSLILQEAKRSKLVADDSVVRGRIDEIKKEYGSDARFQEALKAQGFVQADLETRLRNQMLTFNIIQLKVKSKVIVRPEEVTEYYNRNLDKFSSPEEREVLAVTLENADLARSFAYHLKSGQKLEDLATRYPITVNKLAVARDDKLKKNIESAVFTLGLNEISEPVEIEGKYYVFRLENIIPPHKLPLKEVQEEINNYLLETKMQAAFEKWLEELKGESYIKIIQN